MAATAGRPARDAGNMDDHRAAIARGEKRTLLRTTDGRLWSYAPDELGFRRDGFMQVRTWWGVGIIALVMFAGLVLSAYLFVQPGLADGKPGWTPFWGALWLTAVALLLLVVSLRYMLRELRARRIRRERGVPEPA
ncbi:MAG TPA: hypothetical protein VJR25_12710 [Microbacterium sp.]|uniref:hypothetical protein n=1 Tax=Microbacterium sp. TaxID=51671 RepID=UPI002B481944|nr:hypothetical protein [Microbacterium sp.]HKT57626.1 hypothetical protein [Microbacterium sp.]